MTPAFHFNVLRQFVDVFIEESERMVKMLKSEQSPVIKELVPIISEHTLNVICGKLTKNFNAYVQLHSGENKKYIFHRNFDGNLVKRQRGISVQVPESRVRYGTNSGVQVNNLKNCKITLTRKIFII